MRRKSQPMKFLVLLKGRQPRQDYGAGVHGVTGGKIWLTRSGEAALRHVASIPAHQTIAGASIPDAYSRFLESELAREGEQKHELIAHEKSPNNLWINTVQTNGVPEYFSFPDQELAKHHSELMSNHGKKASVFDGLSRAFRQVNSGSKGAIVTHPHAYKNMIAMRDVLRHESTHQTLNQIAPDWQDSLYGTGHDAEQLMQDADIRDHIHRLVPDYGTDARTLHNEFIARLGNRDGLRDLRLDSNSDRYLRVLSKVLDKGVEHHGRDFYRLFQHAAPIFKESFWRHVAGHQSHPDFGIGVADAHRGKVYLTHDGVIGIRHIHGLPLDEIGKMSGDRVPSVLERISRERDAPMYAVHSEPRQFAGTGSHFYDLKPITTVRGNIRSHQADSEAMARRHIALVTNPDLKRDLFHGLHRAIGEAHEQTGGRCVHIVPPIGKPQYEQEVVEKAVGNHQNRKDKAFVYGFHSSWNVDAKRRLGELLEAHRTGGHTALKVAWGRMLMEGEGK